MMIGSLILGFIIDEGIILAVDSLASLAESPIGGASETYNKIVEMEEGNNIMRCLMAGRLDLSEKVFKQHANTIRMLEHNGSSFNVYQHAEILHSIIRRDDYLDENVNYLLGGYCGGVPKLYLINKAQITSDTGFVVGTGLIHVVEEKLKNEYKHDMNQNDAVELARRCLQIAGTLDEHTGGRSLKVGILKHDEWKLISKNTMEELNEMYNG